MPQRKHLPSGKERPSRRGSGLCAQDPTPINFRQLRRTKLWLSEKHLKRTSSYKRELSLDRGSSNDSETTMTPGHLPIFKRSRVLTHTLGMLLSPRRITFLGRCRAILPRRSSLMPQEVLTLSRPPPYAILLVSLRRAKSTRKTENLWPQTPKRSEGSPSYNKMKL